MAAEYDYDENDADYAANLLMANLGIGRLPNTNNSIYGKSQFSPVQEQRDEDVFTQYDTSPVPLTVIPTSSTQAQRPRTVAAGYREYPASRGQERLGKMTVMFRDGTLYNYYDVTPGEWEGFRNSISKGRPWLNKSNKFQSIDGTFVRSGRNHGRADTSNMSEEVAKTYWKVARLAQVRYSNERAITHTINKPKRGAAGPSMESKKFTGGYVPLNARKKAGLTSRKRRPGANPSNGGTNPYKG